MPEGGSETSSLSIGVYTEDRIESVRYAGETERIMVLISLQKKKKESKRSVADADQSEKGDGIRK